MSQSQNSTSANHNAGWKDKVEEKREEVKDKAGHTIDETMNQAIRSLDGRNDHDGHGNGRFEGHFDLDRYLGPGPVRRIEIYDPSSGWERWVYKRTS